MRRDAIDTLGNDLDCLFSILHWQYREKIPVKSGSTPAKMPKECRFLSKWEKLSLAQHRFEMWYKALPVKEIWPMACYRTFPPVRPTRTRAPSTGHSGGGLGSHRGPFAAPPDRVVVVGDQQLVARDPGALSGQTLPLGGVLHNAGIGNMGDSPAMTPGTPGCSGLGTPGRGCRLGVG